MTHAISAIPLHEFLAENRSRLLELAKDGVRDKAPLQSDDDLIDGIPAVLDAMVASLRGDAGLPTVPANTTEAAATVGRIRHGSQDDIELVVYRIGAISHAVGSLADEMGVTFVAADYHSFNQLIDSSTAAAIGEYATLDRAELQLEHAKRIGFVAHELRNALSAAQLAYVTLKRGILGINSKTGDILGRSLAEMQDLIRQTMTAAQLQGQAPVSHDRVDVSAMVRELEATAAVPSRGVTARWEIEDGLVIDGDRRLLLSATGNVIQNGLKFTRDGGTVTIRAHRGGGRVVLEVADECGSLAPGSEESLFGTFAQHADDRTGMGLGLPIAREAIEAQGGYIAIQNVPGHGCIVRLDLPAGNG